MKKILFLLGTRPEIIKLAPVIEQSRKIKLFETYVCFTGQHEDIGKELFDFFKIKVDYKYKISKKEISLSDRGAIILKYSDKILKKIIPDYCFLLGDTTTAAMGAIACYNNNIKIAYVESGLRTKIVNEPWPEEGYRRIITQVSNLHFAHSKIAVKNLLLEKIDRKNIILSGNPGVDSVINILKILKKNNKIKKNIKKNLHRNNLSEVIKEKFAFVTLHRRENIPYLQGILEVINKVAKENKFFFILPKHPNLKVANIVKNFANKNEYFRIIKPLNYLECIYVMSKSNFIVTDSGGIQEEAPTLKKPVLLIRNLTERPEGIKIGITKMVGTKQANIYKSLKSIISKKQSFFSRKITNPYGDGKSSKKIIKFLEKNAK